MDEHMGSFVESIKMEVVVELGVMEIVGNIVVDICKYFEVMVVVVDVTDFAVVVD